MDEHDQRYPTLREHLDLRERVTVVEGGQTQIMDTLRRMETLLTARPAQAAPAQDSLTLAFHNLADSFRAAQAQKPAGGGNMILVALALVGMGAIGFVIAGILT